VTSHLPWKELGYASAFLFGSCILYGAVYAANVDGREEKLDGWNVVPKYRYGGTTSRTMFGVAHQVDRFVRPEAWLPDKKEVTILEVLPQRVESE
jgi:hypothetical protein